MKRIACNGLVAISLMVAVFSFSACGDGGGNGSPPIGANGKDPQEVLKQKKAELKEIEKENQKLKDKRTESVISLFIWVGIGVLIFCLAHWLKADNSEQKEQIAKNEKEMDAKIARKASEKETEVARNRKRQEVQDIIQPFLTPCLMIDSNIWMDPQANAFFDALEIACKTNEYSFELGGEEFDEFSNQKRRHGMREQGRRARHAISRVESFQEKGYLNIVPISKEPDKKAYADIKILERLEKKMTDGESCTLLTFDKELRIRARQIIKDGSKSEDDYKVVTIDLNDFVIK